MQQNQTPELDMPSANSTLPSNSHNNNDVASGEHPQCILIIRLSAIGDVVLASGLLPALRARYPNAKLSWLTEPATVPLLRGHPELEDILIWDKTGWKRRWKSGEKWAVIQELLNLRRKLKEAKFDWVLDTQGLLKSGIWAWFSGAKRRVGLGSKEGSHRLMTEVTPRDDAAVISSEYRGLIKYLGASDEFVERHYQMSLKQFSGGNPLHSEALSAFVKPIVKAPNLVTDTIQRQQYIVLCPFTTRPQKHWFDHHWIALEALLQEHYQLPCIILGGPADKETGAALAQKMQNAVSLAGHSSLMDSNHIISEAAFLIGVDTGITHMGIMHNVPTVAIFGSTCPYQIAPNTQVLYLNKSCSPCRRRPTCDGRFDCLLEITPEMVIAALSPLVSAQLPEK